MTSPFPPRADAALTATAALLDRDARELAELVRAAQAAPPRAPTVVVVGETKRGKSSLVNALLRQPRLSPVDVDIATCAWLEFRHGPELRATIVRPDTGAHEEIDPADLPDWAGLGGRFRDSEAAPNQIDIRCPAPILQTGLCLVDTPGVGGLEAGHATVTLAALEQASAVLVVIDAGAPPSAPELRFIAAAAERVELVFFALSKTDGYATWRDTQRDARLLVAREVPRLADAPWHPVSARLYERAVAIGGGRAADELVRESGIPALGSALQVATSGRAALLDAANALRTARAALDRYETQLVQRARLADPSAEDAEEAQRVRAEALRSTQRAQRELRSSLAGSMRRVRESVSPKLNAERVELADVWQRRLDAGPTRSNEQISQDLGADLVAMTLRVSAEVTVELQQIAYQVLTDYLPAHSVAELAARLVATAELEGAMSSDPAFKNRMEKRVMLFTGATSGVSLGRTVAMLVPQALGSSALFSAAAITGSALFMPAALALGGVISVVLFRMRSKQMDRQLQRGWVLETIGKAVSQLQFAITTAIRDADEELAAPVEDALLTLQEQADEDVRAIERAQHEERSQRAANRRQLDEQRAAARQQGMRVDALVTEVRRSLLTRGEAPARPTARPAGRPARPVATAPDGTGTESTGKPGGNQP